MIKKILFATLCVTSVLCQGLTSNMFARATTVANAAQKIAANNPKQCAIAAAGAALLFAARATDNKKLKVVGAACAGGVLGYAQKTVSESIYDIILGKFSEFTAGRIPAFNNKSNAHLVAKTGAVALIGLVIKFVIASVVYPVKNVKAAPRSGFDDAFAAFDCANNYASTIVPGRLALRSAPRLVAFLLN